MFAGNWFGKKNRLSSSIRPLAKGRRRKAAAQDLRRRLHLEELEDRRMLAVFTVSNTLDLDPDNGNLPFAGSLRQAVNLANANPGSDTILFADFLFTDPASGITSPQTISLSGLDEGGQLLLTDPVDILGPGASVLTIDAGGSDDRIFETMIGENDVFFSVTIAGMTLTGGSVVGSDDTEDKGGAIFNREALTLVEVDIVGNSASTGGGAVFLPFGSLNLERSLVRNNTSGGGGGGIFGGADGDEMRPTVNIRNSTITGNSTSSIMDQPGFGGGVFNRNGTLNVSNSTIVSNTAPFGGGVSSYGVADIDMDIPIVTSVNHSILHSNMGGDLMPVFSNSDGDFIVPTVNARTEGTIASQYNFIGQITGAQFFDSGDGVRSNFYQVIPAVDGIDWAMANRIANLSGGHLATLTTQAENDFVFDNLVDNGAFWAPFQPPDIDDGMGGTTTPDEVNIGPWLGGRQIVVGGPAIDDWEWVTVNDAPFDDEFQFTNWAAMHPDDGLESLADPMDPLLDEDRMHFFSPSVDRAGTWGDLLEIPESERTPIAFVIEYEQTNNAFNVDPALLALADNGGSTQTIYPNNDPTIGPISQVIDFGDPNASGTFEQRGRHFVRSFDGDGDMIPTIDVGAVEVQQGTFVVDALVDEADGQFSGGLDPNSPDPTRTTVGDFALREAIQFSETNPEFDTILFSPGLAGLPDPTGSLAPTILLRLQTGANTALTVTKSVDILGPIGFELEIDTAGTDPSPLLDNGDGTRVFQIDNFDLFSEVDVRLTNLTFLGGDVNENGGAFLNRENLTIVNSTIKESSAGNLGGGVFTQFGSLTLDSTTLTQNIAAQGGGLYVESDLPGEVTTATVHNSTVSGNSASVRGGGVYNSNGEVLIEFSTITDNNAAFNQGGGVASLPGIDTLTQIRSSIVSQNSGRDVQFISGATTIQSLGFNLIGDGNAAVVFNQPGDQSGVLDPMIAPLGQTGGRNPNHRLLPGSPAIDLGDSVAIAGVAGVPLQDQRGFPFTRVFDGVQDTKDRIDIGSYEVQPTTFIVDTLSNIDDGNIGPSNFSLREAVEASNLNPLTDTIIFDPSLLGGTIGQSGLDLLITDSVDIIGLGESLLTLDGSSAFDPVIFGDKPRFFTIDDGNNASDIQVTIRDIRFQNSENTTFEGGAIKSLEDLTLQRISFVNNSTDGVSPLGEGLNGGAIYQRYGSLILDDITLTGNRTNGVDSDGGAVYVLDADLTVLNNSSITGNSTTQTQGSGGGIYISNGTLNMSNSFVANNLAPAGAADGAGIFGNQAVLNLVDSFVSGNSMTGSNSEGAGIFGINSDLNLTRTVVASNYTTGTLSEGAGIYLRGGDSTIDQSYILLNSTEGLYSTGAGLSIIDGTVLITNSTIENNTTTGDHSSGGGIHNLGGDVTIRGTTVANNSVSGSLDSLGGGIFSSTDLSGNHTTTVLNSTISGNSSALRGGGVYNAAGLTKIQHSTITNNTAPFGFGPGVASLGTGATQTEVVSSIIAENVASNVPGGSPDDIAFVSSGTNSFLSQGFNLVGNGTAAAAFNQTGDQTGVNDPKLGPLANNGGRTFTHELLVDSPAIGAGDPNFNANTFSPSLDADQRGGAFLRVLAGRIDIGAFESVFPFAPADFNQNGRVNGGDFLSWQRGFGITSGATKADGDADNNGAVNGDDLDQWQAGFGDPPPLAAIASGFSEGLAASYVPVAVVEKAAETLAIEENLAMPLSQPIDATPRIVTGLELNTFSPMLSNVVDTITSTNPLRTDLEVIDESIGQLTASGESYRTSTSGNALEELGLWDHRSEEDSIEDEQLAEDLVFAQLGSFGL